MPATSPQDPAIGSESIGAIGLFLPFLIVLGAVLALGGHQAKQLAPAMLLVVFPIAILIVRARARRSAARPSS